MPQKKKGIAIGATLAGLAGLAIALARRKPAGPPEETPSELKGSFFGTVSDPQSNQPLWGVKVSIGDVTGYTNSAGEYRLDIKAGSYRADFTKAGYETVSYLGLAIVSGENERNVWMIKLPSPTDLKGVVTNLAGKPVDGVLVTLTRYKIGKDGGTEQVYYETSTGSGGGYSFRVEAATFAISFIHADYQTQSLSVSLQPDMVNVLNLELVPVVSGLRLYFSNPKLGATAWDANVFDLGTQQWLPGNPKGVKELHIPCDFDINRTGYLLRVMEQQWGGSAYWLGPYFIEAPPGVYTWDSKAGKMDGIVGINLPEVANESQVVGVIRGLDWLDEARWGVDLDVLETLAVSGKMNTAGFFHRIYIEYAQIPLDEARQPIPQVGEKVRCRVTMVRTTYSYAWQAWDFTRDSGYPAGSFSGAITIGGTVQKWIVDPESGGYYQTMREITLSVSGGIAPFAAMLVVFNLSGNVCTGGRYIGPRTELLLVAEDAYQLGYCSRPAIYANPDPNAPAWNKYSWRYYNWQAVK